MQIKVIQCKNALHKVQGGFPYRWDLNIYRGCEHKCKYCFAVYTHKYMQSQDYFSEIFIKENIVEVLEKELKSRKWKSEVINIGGVTDSYQPAEAEHKLMPEILKLMIKYKNPVVISSKSDLILRDFDLIAELAELTIVNIAQTITTIDEKLQKIVEPGGVSPKRRFETLKRFSKTKAVTGLHVMPVIPFLADSAENIEGLFAYGKESNVDYAIMQILNLRGQTKKNFFSFIDLNFPELYESFSKLYKTSYADKEYSKKIYSVINKFRKHYNIPNYYKKDFKGIVKDSFQPELF